MNIDKVVAHIDDYDWHTRMARPTKTVSSGGRPSSVPTAPRPRTSSWVFSRFLPGASMSTHYHAPAEVYYVYAGRGQLAIDGETRSVREGSVVYVPRNVVHGIENVGDTLLTLMWMFPGEVWADIEYHLPQEAGF